jgi:hypothetical protein
MAYAWQELVTRLLWEECWEFSRLRSEAWRYGTPIANAWEDGWVRRLTELVLRSKGYHPLGELAFLAQNRLMLQIDELG